MIINFTDIYRQQVIYECSISSLDLKTYATVMFVIMTFFVVMETRLRKENKEDIYQWILFISYMAVSFIWGLVMFNN